MLKSIICLIRPKHWIKNIFVFLPVLFSLELKNIDQIGKSSFVFACFCLIASSIYSFNDVIDVNKDRLHSIKKKRPVASGEIKIRDALCISFILFTIGLSLAYFFNRGLFWILLLYTFTNLLYTLKVKNVVILDVIFIAFGFVYRILGGATVSTILPSNWIIMTTFFLALFLGFAKRRSEIYIHSSRDFTLQRDVLSQYSHKMLDLLLSSVMVVTVLCYSLYTSTNYVTLRFGNNYLVYTIPFVVFGMYRYFHLIHHAEKGENPVEILINDKLMFINMCFWIITCTIIIY